MRLNKPCCFSVRRFMVSIKLNLKICKFILYILIKVI
ncbi:hypothetical protein VPHD164_0037 [Vibrio phage D164]